jgi:hypothetical protein
MKSKYRYTTKNGIKRTVHSLIAEKALGRELKKPECVHHIDYDKHNNENNNLVICPDKSYHMLLHIRTDALNKTGDANKRKCHFCQRHDDIANMHKAKNRTESYFHNECAKDYQTIRRCK